jgi:hypothetical protein
MRPSVCTISLTGASIARSIHSSRIDARSGRMRNASNYRVHFTATTYQKPPLGCSLTTELSGWPPPLCRGQTRHTMFHGPLERLVRGDVPYTNLNTTQSNQGKTSNMTETLIIAEVIAEGSS